MKELILNNNFDYIDYIIENDTLYLDTKNIALLGDSNERTVYRHCNTVLDEYLTIDNFDNRLYITRKVGKTQKKFYSHYIVGDVLHRLKSPQAIKFRIWANEKTFRQPEQPKSLEKEALETISYLENKVWEHTKNAFESPSKEEFIQHMDLADKYAMDSQKRRFQLRNEINCNNRLKRELELNRKGFLTESTENQVFIPESQTKLIEFKICINKED